MHAVWRHLAVKCSWVFSSQRIYILLPFVMLEEQAVVGTMMLAGELALGSQEGTWVCGKRLVGFSGITDHGGLAKLCVQSSQWCTLT